jgi:hypothetical protein
MNEQAVSVLLSKDMGNITHILFSNQSYTNGEASPLQETHVGPDYGPIFFFSFMV